MNGTHKLPGRSSCLSFLVLLAMCCIGIVPAVAKFHFYIFDCSPHQCLHVFTLLCVGSSVINERLNLSGLLCGYLKQENVLMKPEYV